jgi:hypothetical protein
MIAVPIPFTGIPGRADLSYITAAAEAVAGALRGAEVIVLKSTTPPGTTRWVSELIAAFRRDVHSAHCPECVLPGRIMIEIATNDRVVGGLPSACAERAVELHSGLDSAILDWVAAFQNPFQNRLWSVRSEHDGWSACRQPGCYRPGPSVEAQDAQTGLAVWTIRHAFLAYVITFCVITALHTWHIPWSAPAVGGPVLLAGQGLAWSYDVHRQNSRRFE